MASCATSPTGRPRRSSISSAGPYTTRRRAELPQPIRAGDGRGDERDICCECDPGRPRMSTGDVLLAKTLRAAGPLREHDDHIASSRKRLGRSDRRGVALPTPHLEASRARDKPTERRPEQLRLRHETEETSGEKRNPERPWIEARGVVRREHIASCCRQILQAGGFQPIQPTENRPAQSPEHEVRE